jgi:hypothetical protein
LICINVEGKTSDGVDMASGIEDHGNEEIQELPVPASMYAGFGAISTGFCRHAI